MFVVEDRQQTLAWMVVVEVRQGPLVGDGRGEEEEEDEEEDDEEEEKEEEGRKDNPHLAGGEKNI